MAEVKFCGLTRSADVHEAVRLGASFVGVILASGPRLLQPEQARSVLSAVPRGVSRVGVFGARPPEAIADDARRAGVDIVQLHADPDAAVVAAVREHFAGPVWAVVRIAGEVVPPVTGELFAAADALVLDARSERGLGGTGETLPWAALATRLAQGRGGRASLVLAGGLTAANVVEAIDALAPDVVDVSSGVESAPGVKDHSLMGAFARAARPRRGAA